MDGSFDWFREHHTENMERMFAAVGELYAEQWGEFFHFALFEEGDDPEDRDAAFERTHRHYAEALQVGGAAKVLEVACGRGGFAAFLAARTEGDVLGIDISRAQLARAARRHRRPNVRFRRHDAMRVEDLGERFDAVAFLDTECYLPDKGAALAGIARVMTPGARLLLLTWCRREGLGRIQEELSPSIAMAARQPTPRGRPRPQAAHGVDRGEHGAILAPSRGAQPWRTRGVDGRCCARPGRWPGTPSRASSTTRR